MFTIEQRGEQWVLLNAQGEQVGELHNTYELALGELATLLHAQLAIVDAENDADSDGLLPEPWFSELCFSEVASSDDRDFSEVTWTARDPGQSTMPLMLQTSTEYGHFGAQLAGFFTEINLGPSPTARGRFYDSECGIQLRDMLLGDRRFGVSVDPGHVEGEFVCTEVDDEGWCEAGFVRFDEYEIIGVTATPFPGFANAYITLEAAAEPAPAESAPASIVAVDGGVATDAVLEAHGMHAAAGRTARSERPLRATPPRAWFDRPDIDEPTPLSIDDDGDRVYAHLAAWGSCHVGSERVCVAPPASQLNYRRFVHGVDELRANGSLRHTSAGVLCANGERVATGVLTWGIPHADLNASMISAFDHYADASHGWADVAIGEDEFGIWIAGRVRPNVSDGDLSVLRALALSGDWRHDPQTRQLELVGALAVNVPGFPIPRLVAAAGVDVAQPETRAGIGDGFMQRSLVASGIITPRALARLERTRPCGCSEASTIDSSLHEAWRSQVTSLLVTLDRRTKHLTPAAIEHLGEQLGIEPEPVLPPGSYVPRPH